MVIKIMANPFQVRFDSTCNSCGFETSSGDLMYYVEGLYYCKECARKNGNVCECGKFKKSLYPLCFDCKHVRVSEEKEEDF